MSYTVKFRCKSCGKEFESERVESPNELVAIMAGRHPQIQPIIGHPCNENDIGIGECCGLNLIQEKELRVLESPIAETGEHTLTGKRGRGRPKASPSSAPAIDPTSNVRVFLENRNIDIPSKTKKLTEESVANSLDINNLVENTPTGLPTQVDLS